MSLVSDQTGATLQYLADLRDIGAAEPARRKLTDPKSAAALLGRELMSRIEATVQAHSGDPVVLLSGGVDSIAVAAAAAHLGVRPHTLTVITDHGTDATTAAAAAAALGLPHEVIRLDEHAVPDLARESVRRLGIPELWEVSYAIPLLAVRRTLELRSSVGPILTGSAADAILAGGKTLQHPIDSAAAIEELDRIVRRESAGNFRYNRLVPDFYARVLGGFEDRFVHVFQTLRFWEIAETLAPTALFGYHDGAVVDKLCLRLACEDLLPDPIKPLAWGKKNAIQRSAGIMDSLAAAARRFAAATPGAETYSDPMNEPYESVASRLFLALLSDGNESARMPSRHPQNPPSAC
ncbi:asparagine synthase-related protein [Nocardia brasiliensis]|uniref:asparagine synthase-related protein n=1 Tax=Nocardia brasiliensis TaxID=37326 RepID=UPI002453A036|nr:asparagine synthase-related protein [Nocardia brasiliensis]